MVAQLLDLMVPLTLHLPGNPGHGAKVCYRASQIQRTEDLPEGGCRLRIKDSGDIVVGETAWTVGGLINRLSLGQP